MSLPLKSLALMRSLAVAAVGLSLLSAHAQKHIYRCGNEYLNNAEVARSRGCLPMEGGNVTIVRGLVPQRNTPPAGAASTAAPRAPQAAAASRPGAERVDASAQRARDSDAKAILEGELRRAQDRLAQAQKDYANGEPEKQGIESRNHQRYLDRVAELKAALARAQGDVDSLKRELTRFGGPSQASTVQ